MSIIESIRKDEQELELVRDESGYRSEWKRAQVLLALGNSGLSQRGVGRALGHAPSYVNETVRRYRAEGLHGLRELRGRNTKLRRRSEILALLPELVAGSPRDHGWNRSTWSVEVVALEVERQLCVRVSRTHTGRLLRLTGCRRVTPKPTIALAPKDHLEQAIALQVTLAKVGARDIVLYSDEVDIHLNPKVGPDWMPHGVRKELVTPGRNRKHYIAGAYDPDTERLIAVDGPSKNSLLFIDLVKKLAEIFEDRGTVHLVVDNYIIHKSKITQRALEALGGKVKLHFLPPYCPEYNPIERVWWDLHAHITRNQRHPGIEQLMDQVRQYIAVYTVAGALAASVSRTAQSGPPQ
ncbi:MAG: transposase [Myxococcota bacterium]|jgi:transposase